MIEVILQVIMIVCAFGAGYGVRAMKKMPDPMPKRGANGRFEKRK